MDFEFSDAQRALQATVRKFARREVEPLAHDIDRDERFPHDNFKKAAELGLLGITIPEGYGGSGGTYTDMMIVAEELGAVCASTCVACLANACLFGDNVFRNGGEHVKQKYLPPMCAGGMVGGVAMTEPEAGSDVAAMKMRAEKRGDHYLLNGTKTFITNGPVADALVVYAKTAPEKGAYGISAFVVEKGFPGFSTGKKFVKMGWRGSPTGEVILENCVVPEENLLGTENNGVRVLMSGLNTERLGMGAMSVGIARGAFEKALNHAQERRQFGKPLTEFQHIQAKLVDMAVNIEAARLLVYKGATLADRGYSRELNLLASYAKLFASEMCMHVTTEAVQVFGGYGYINEFPLERYMRDAKIMTIGGGTSEIQKLIIIRELLR